MKRLALIVALAVLAGPSVCADSLYPGSSTAAKTELPVDSLFADHKARRIGDTLTVVINESAIAQSKANTSNSKNENLNYGPGTGGLKIGPIHLDLGKITNFGITGSTSSAGTGSTDRTDTLSGEISVTVKDVLPNGNLVVEGKRKVGMNSETQQITLTGIVRPQDIAANNTIASPLVADAQITLNGKGTVGDKQHDGLITRVFKFLF